MNRISALSRLFIVFLTGMVLMTSCGGSNSGSARTSVDSTPKGPAPDNNSATNPSSADTNYQKDTGRQVTDSTRPRH